jgi:CubicO group peptidase (beta-lactamase class C family)
MSKSDFETSAPSRFGALLLAVVLAACAAPAEMRTVDDLDIVSESGSLLFWSPEQQLVGYRNIEHIFPTRPIAAGANPYPLPAAHRELPDFTYSFDGRARTIADFMEQMNVTGLLVLKDGDIVLEEYAHGNDERTLWTSFSVAKSVVALLYGAALADGYIGSVHDPITDYLPSLAGTVYEGVTIENILQMSSGVAWNEDYSDPNSDVARLGGVAAVGGIEGMVGYMADLPRAAPPGSVFNYSTGETDIAGAVLSAAVGRNLSEYLGERIWQPFGMEADAYWMLIREDDLERAGCCISATLRDYGRIGLLALRDGVAADGSRLIPEGWMEASSSPAESTPGYGYFWWLLQDGRYHATGIFGQHVHVNPADGVVIAIHSFWPRSGGREFTTHRAAFIDAITEAVAGR